MGEDRAQQNTTFAEEYLSRVEQGGIAIKNNAETGCYWSSEFRLLEHR